MSVGRYKFRILFSVLCIVVAVLPLIGIILTIGHGSPFDFLFPLSMPGWYLLDGLDHFLPLPEIDGLFLVLLALPLNLLLYFLAGYLVDYIVNRFCTRRRITP